MHSPAGKSARMGHARKTGVVTRSGFMATTAAAPPSQPPTPQPKAEHPLCNKNFVMWWLGSTISLFGDQFYVVALPWVVLQLTGSGIAMGTVAMCAGIPRAVLMLMGGAVTDRTSPRKLLMLTASARTVLVAAIGVLLWYSDLHLWHLYLLAIGFGIADAFALPSASAMMRNVVKLEQLPAANSIWQSSALLTSVAGPAPAGAIMKAFGAAWAFFLDAISFLFVIGALWKLPDSPPARPVAAKPSIWKSIGEGLAYVGKDIALRTLLLLTAVMNFCLSGPLQIGLAYMAKQRFSSPVSFGFWVSSVAAGTLLGMLLAGVIKSKQRGVLLMTVTTALGAGTVGMGFLPGLWPVAALLLAMGLLNGYVTVQIQAWFQQRVDRAVLGRVVSLVSLSAFGLMPLSMGLAGVAVEWGTRWMFVISGVALMLVSTFGLAQKPVREIQ